MTAGTYRLAADRVFRRHRHTVGFVAASIIWAAVMIDTGQIAWPLAMWIATALGPLSLHRHRSRDDP
ncbi:MAG: hypothetical protein R2707_03460 [Acidimicrobiales bacterium]